MRRWIFAAFFVLSCVSNSCLAAGRAYNLKMELSIKGQKVSSPRLVVKQGQTATITQRSGQRNNFIEVVANDALVHGRKGILMNFVVGTVDRHGQKTVISRPQVFVKEAKQATITQGDLSGNEDLSLSVIAFKKSL